MNKLKPLITILVLSLISSTPVSGKTSGSLRVSTTVINSCRSISTDDVDPGNFNLTATADTSAAQGPSTFHCTKNTSYRAYLTGSDATDNSSPGTPVYPVATGNAPGTASGGTSSVADLQGTIAASQDVRHESHVKTIYFTIEY